MDEKVRLRAGCGTAAQRLFYREPSRAVEVIHSGDLFLPA